MARFVIKQQGCDVSFGSSVEKRKGDQDLSGIVQQEIGDAHRELRDPGEGIEDQHHIRRGK